MPVPPIIPRSSVIVFLRVVRQVCPAGFVSATFGSHFLPQERAACIEARWIMSYETIREKIHLCRPFGSFCFLICFLCVLQRRAEAQGVSGSGSAAESGAAHPGRTDSRSGPCAQG